MFRYALCLIMLSSVTHAHETPYVRALIDGPKVIHFDSNVGFETPFAIASAGKVFTSVALLRLVDQGVMDLDDPAHDWLPQDVVAGFDGMDDITLNQLATMSSGLPDYYDDAFVDAISNMPDGIQAATFAVSFAYDEPTVFAPGEGFDYSNTNYVLLGMVMETATGQSYADIIQDEVIDPLGLRGTFVFGSRPLPDTFTGGHFGGRHVKDYYENPGFGDGGIITTANDMAVLYSALRNGRFLTAQSRSALVTDPIGDGYAMGIVIDDDQVWHNGGDFGATSFIAMDWATGRIALEFIGQSDADTSWAENALD